MIIRIENWDRRTALCRVYGFRAAIVYDHRSRGTGFSPVACITRTRAKDWAGQRFGPPMSRNWSNTDWVNTDSEWLAYRSAESEYTVAFKDRRARDWCLLL